MTNIPFDHEGCNAWAIYESQYIDAENAHNMHIVEGTIDLDEAGKRQFRPNSGKDTICSLKLKNGKRQYLFCSNDPSEIRSKVANLQNGGHEVCGTCVSRFYADQEC